MNTNEKNTRNRNQFRDDAFLGSFVSGVGAGPKQSANQNGQS